MKISLIKVFRDIVLYKGRTILTLVGVLIGIAAVGAVLSAYSILTREMNRNFMATNPASMVLMVGDLDQKAVKLIQKSYDNTEIELRKTILARVDRGDGTYGTIYLRAVEDFQRQKVDTFSLEKGRFPQKISEMVLERDCLKILKNLQAGVGENLRIKLPGGVEKKLQLSGIVHAPGLAPASMEHFSYGFLNLAGLQSLGYQGWYDEIRIVCHQNRFDREQMKQISGRIKKTLLENGYRVNRVYVPEPGKHPHAGQLASLLFLLQSFTVIALLVACIIIVNLLNFIMARQSKQIAIMKAVGADFRDIAISYFFYVFMISSAALLLSIPLAIWAGCGYSNFAAGILNFKILSYTIPGWVFGIQVLIGIMVPFVPVAYPILRNCTISVKDGLGERIETVNTVNWKPRFNKRKLAQLNSQILIPLNNLIRKKSRTFLAILALAAGGTLFMTSQNIVASIDKTVAESFKTFSWDYDIRLAQVYPEEQLNKALKKIHGLAAFEVWETSTVLLKKPDGTDSAWYPVKLMPDKTEMLKLSLAEQLLKQTGMVMVVNKVLADDEGWIVPGVKSRIEVGGKTATIIISGIVNEVPPMPTIYMKRSTYKNLSGTPAKQVILARAKTRDISSQHQITKITEETFQSAGIELAENWNIFILRKAFVDHLHVILTFLSIVATLSVLVGGLSIASAIGINVSERKREIGVLRAIGGNSFQVIKMILTEVCLMGISGWLIGVILSYPVSVWVGNYFGQIFLHTDLQSVLSVSGAIQWLLISMAVSLIAGFLPAWNVANDSLKEMLAYE